MNVNLKIILVLVTVTAVLHFGIIMPILNASAKAYAAKLIEATLNHAK